MVFAWSPWLPLVAVATSTSFEVSSFVSNDGACDGPESDVSLLQASVQLSETISVDTQTNPVEADPESSIDPQGIMDSIAEAGKDLPEEQKEGIGNAEDIMDSIDEFGNGSGSLEDLIDTVADTTNSSDGLIKIPGTNATIEKPNFDSFEWTTFNYYLGLPTAIAVLLYCCVACCSSKGFNFWIVAMSAAATYCVIWGHGTGILSMEGEALVFGKQIGGGTPFELRWPRVISNTVDAQAWPLWISLVSCVLVLPYVALILILLVITLVLATKMSVATGCNTIAIINRFTKWAFFELFVFCYLYETVVARGQFEVRILGISQGALDYDFRFSLTEGAMSSLCGFALICLLAYHARRWLEQQLVADEGTSTSQTNDNGQVSIVVASRDKMTARLCYAAIAFLLISWLTPLGYISKTGLFGELLQENSRQTSSLFDMVWVMTTNPSLVEQQVPVILAAALIMMNLVIPFAQFVLLSRSADAARKDPEESKRYLQRAEFCSIFDCTEVTLLTVIVMAVNLEPCMQTLFAPLWEELEPELKKPDMQQNLAVLNIDATVSEWIEIAFRFGPAPIALFNTWVLRALLFTFVKDMISRSKA